MFGIKKWTIALAITVIFWVGYWCFLFPYYPSEPIQDVYPILFLDYDVMNEYGFSHFSINLKILFCLLFYCIYHFQLSVFSENTSYISMVCNHLSKKQLVRMIIKELLLDHMWYWIVGVFNYCLVTVVSTIVLQQLSFDATLFHSFCIYWFKYIFIICVILLVIRLLLFIEEKPQLMISGYIVFMILFILDFLLDTRFISYVSSLNLQIIYLLIVGGIGMVIGVIAVYRFINSKEYFYD